MPYIVKDRWSYDSAVACGSLERVDDDTGLEG